MGKSNKVIKSTVLIMVFGLLSKPFGFIRELLIASKFGSGVETDTFFIALTATALVTGFISSAIVTTFIPILSEIEASEGKKGKIDHTNNMINIVFFISMVLVIIGFFFAPIIVKVLAKGFEGEQFDLAVKLIRVGLPMIIFGGIIGVFTGYLQSEERFTSTSLISFPFNFIYIVFLLFFSSSFGIKGLMVAAVLAVISQFLILLPEAKISGYKYSFKFDLRDKYIKKALYLSLPVLIGVAINDLNAIIDRTLGSSLAPGSISALNYANKFQGLVLGLFITAFITVVFPLLSKEFSDDNIPGVKRIMNYGINLILLITVPATVGLIVLSTPIVEIAFQRGEFGQRATLMTSSALVFYSIGLVSMGLRLLLNRIYYSLQDTRAPMINGAISVGFNIVLNLVLVKYMDHNGLALATSLATTIATVLLLYGLRQKIGSLGTRGYIRIFIKTAIASLIMGVVVYIIYNGVYGILGVSKLYNIISLISAVLVGAVVYGVLCYIFKVEEVRDVIGKIRNTIRG